MIYEHDDTEDSKEQEGNSSESSKNEDGLSWLTLVKDAAAASVRAVTGAMERNQSPKPLDSIPSTKSEKGTDPTSGDGTTQTKERAGQNSDEIRLEKKTKSPEVPSPTDPSQRDGTKPAEKLKPERLNAPDERRSASATPTELSEALKDTARSAIEGMAKTITAEKIKAAAGRIIEGALKVDDIAPTPQDESNKSTGKVSRAELEKLMKSLSDAHRRDNDIHTQPTIREQLEGIANPKSTMTKEIEKIINSPQMNGIEGQSDRTNPVIPKYRIPELSWELATKLIDRSKSTEAQQSAAIDQFLRKWAQLELEQKNK